MATRARRSKPRRRTRVPHGLGGNDPAPDFSDGRLEVRPSEFVVRADGAVVELTPTELALLVELIRHRGAVRTREQLLRAVWGRRRLSGSRIVDVTMVRLRAKIAARIGDVAYFHTHPRLGYRFEAGPAE